MVYVAVSVRTAKPILRGRDFSMQITGNFPGGNIQVLRVDGDTVYLSNESRDTEGSYFYWAFRVEGAQGRTLHFSFGDRVYVSYWGAAVSTDRRTWRWSEGADHDGTGFTYRFSESEDLVYFAHDMNYPLERFLDFATEACLPLSTLVTSEGGRDVPMVRLGTEGPTLLLTSRHHCCESTGTYLLEGFLREFTRNPPKGFRVLAIPFIDIDGAVNGDQGKNRRPHDHNRDYIEHPVWRSTAALMKMAPGEDIQYHLDLHAPAHRGFEHDYVYLLRTPENDNLLREQFSQLLEEETLTHRESFPFCHAFAFDRYVANPGSCVYFFSHQPGMKLSATIESTYAGNYYRKVSMDNLVALGQCAARAMRKTMGF